MDQYIRKKTGKQDSGCKKHTGNQSAGAANQAVPAFTLYVFSQ
ncbi:hypothetical protein GCM10008922_24180 [Faecalicatena contorta]|nr:MULTISPECIES: hypothetical protein [Clostridia]MEE0199716.1 hypothetical protein [Muricomes sp.]GKH31222.1 hypothetical protein CE91St64_06290 [Faecalicatena contorta]